jgi:hypothetical protein
MDTFLSVTGDMQARLRRLVLLSGPGEGTRVFDLGSAELSFDGGVSYEAGTGWFHGIGNRPDGVSELHRFRLQDWGATRKTAELGRGFQGGLVRVDGAYYAPARGQDGVTLLHRWEEGGDPIPVASFGIGYSCGLTWNPLDGRLYGLFRQEGGRTELLRMRPRRRAEVEALPVNLGRSDFGGLAFDPLERVFHAIRNTAYGDSVLMRLSLDPAWEMDDWVAGSGYFASTLIPTSSLRMGELVLPAVPAASFGWPGTTFATGGEGGAARFDGLLAV